jgi:class 3 adenylate cyclase/ABC-type oligopeptide transport system substrate-binding subunit/DNA-binding beta-propeller fold protein YncE
MSPSDATSSEIAGAFLGISFRRGHLLPRRPNMALREALVVGTGASEDRPRGTEIRTFLIADVRGYTTYTRESGDESAAELAAKFAGVVREVVEAREGLLLELRGDEALVVFTSARQGLRAAVELQDRFKEIGLPRGVGIGLDAGEAVAVEGGFRGGALNLAARLCARAEAGQVLASEAVIHLAAKVNGIAYVDPRTLRLKGYAAPVRAVEVLPADRVPRGVSRRVKRVRRRLGSDRRLAAGIAGVLAIAASAALLVAVLGGGSDSSLAGLPAGIALIDQENGDVVASMGTTEVKNPVEVIFAEGSFWVLNLAPISFVQVHPRTGKIVRQIASPFADVGWYAVEGGTLWVIDYQGSGLSKVDTSLGREVERFDLATDRRDRFVGSNGVAVAAGSVWVGRKDPVNEVLRVDPATGDVQHRFRNMFGSTVLAAGDGSVWTSGGRGVNRIDSATNTVTRVQLPITGPGGTEFIEAGGGFGWATNETKGELYKIDRRGHVVATYRTGLGARRASFNDGAVWVTNQDVGTVTGIDALSSRQTTHQFEHPVQAAGAGDGVVLAALLPGRTFEDRIAELSGDVAKLFVEPYQLGEPGDPALNQNFLSFQVASATCLRLLNHPDAPAPKGWELRPEAAGTMPAVSADGRTYTFTVKKGYAFSPPSNAPVTAQTFAYSIERALSPKLGEDTPGPRFLGDIEGVRAFREGRAKHVAGVRAKGATLSITLEAASGDFLERLAMPFFCPVPTGTPIVPGGAVVSLPGGAGRSTTPSAGPYYLADTFNGEYAILRQNPNYPGPRPRVLDAIALREGVDSGLAVSRVRDEGWHGIMIFFDPLLEPGGALDAQWGPTSAAARGGDQRVFATPLPHLGYIVFNAGKAPFGDANVRRAAALAMNRRTLAAVWQLIPTDQLLPSLEPGFKDRDIFALGEPNLTQARKLMRGRTVTAAMGISPDCDPCRQEAEALAGQLAAIGIDIDIEEVDEIEEVNADDAVRQGKIDLFDGGTDLDYLDAASFLEALLLRDVPHSWLPASVGRAVEQVTGLSGARRRRQANALADRLARKDVPVAAVGVGQIGGFFSPELGCRVFPPLGYGIDLATLCLADN